MEKQSLKNKHETPIEELFGKVLLKIRKEKGISHEELGFESGYHRTYIRPCVAYPVLKIFFSKKDLSLEEE